MQNFCFQLSSQHFLAARPCPDRTSQSPGHFKILFSVFMAWHQPAYIGPDSYQDTVVFNLLISGNSDNLERNANGGAADIL